MGVSERDVSRLRREYAQGGLSEEEMAPEPLDMFALWLDQAMDAGLTEPNAMVLASTSAIGAPSSRTVLLKQLTSKGFVFFTNYSSSKGVELAADPRCALLFCWFDLERQVRVEGTARRLAGSDNDAYFALRPRPAQVGAWASPQSQVVGGRTDLEQRYDEQLARFGSGPVPRPEHWGGYVVEPQTVEFWQGRPGRMHDRLRYRAADGAWVVERLAP